MSSPIGILEFLQLTVLSIFMLSLIGYGSIRFFEIFEDTGFRPKRVFFDTSKPEGIFSRAADLTRARRLLDWEPKVSFDEGLKCTIKWCYSTADKNEVLKRLRTLLFER